MQPQYFAPGGALTLLGALWCREAIPSLVRGWSTTEWPTVRGTVTARHLADADGRSGLYPLAVGASYKYDVNGTRYIGSRISYRYIFPFYSGSKIDRLFEEHPIGATVTVHYDPHRPERSVLKPGTGAGNYVAVAIGLIILTVGMNMVRSGFL